MIATISSVAQESQRSASILSKATDNSSYFLSDIKTFICSICASKSSPKHFSSKTIDVPLYPL